MTTRDMLSAIFLTPRGLALFIAYITVLSASSAIFGDVGLVAATAAGTFVVLPLAARLARRRS